ncbi:DUF1266 domain-containing protein [Aneurinibacillus aneurinilyticus]|uniref:DUF1266 domain-containing protein n=2 Tax=Aneurinibacillus aneurinilyticus TaxID=1391 RepID=A0A848CX09_ANEAE|nr:DUF1266 domain-containing protein [Aneurinibacillus aneurinilyticus]ERI10634.1 hypothetical protein HMPREF0083_01263 [Aneurinibacillus aneurinilyticus ATCC 12856]MCI1696800.1 DUF1266 domain-containing protein [Aneurinibacillus aneurinilyticus]MED0673539.1 DUF1266 domain-containing protein [Aneurinibacillus aneurinilyticus]MED0705651.1 DUF1266 domain-containing protein [Aneurinibacillus aneurinilyticus]MED0724245.1 DUF1266 domain-containing protein [Aneurinibacillus aneurinilyticus]
MKTFLIIVGVIVAIVILLIVGLITASRRIEKKNKKLRVEMEMANPLPKEKQHLLAYGANLSLYRSESPRILPMKVDYETLKEGLSSYWDVSNSEEAMQTLEWLLTEGHRAKYDQLLMALKAGQSFTEEEVGKSQECYESAQEAMMKKLSFVKSDFDRVNTIAAWDFDRAVNIARWSYILGYITEEQAWGYIERAADAASHFFQSWKEYFISFAFGRAIAYEGDIYDILWNGKELLNEEDSIWNEFSIKRSGTGSR